MNDKLIPRAMLIALLACTVPVASFSFVSVGVSVGFAPPALPLYAQPPCPAPGYLWTPGYWAYSPEASDYYWVPGTWVIAPEPGLLWTPGYWAVAGGAYLWNAGYWGPHVGFYGGINYGYGYFGAGFEGGYWREHDFYYNRAVTNISNVNVTNVYNRTVLNTNYYGNRPSFNGGAGVHAVPATSDLMATHEPHRGLTQPQKLQATSALNVPGSRASVNHGYPAVAATARPGAFQNRDVVPTHYASLASSSHYPPQSRAGAHSIAPHTNGSAWSASRANTPLGANSQQQGATRAQWQSPAQVPAARQAPIARVASESSYRTSQPHPQAPHASYPGSRYGGGTPPNRQGLSQAPSLASYRPSQNHAQAPRNSFGHPLGR